MVVPVKDVLFNHFQAHSFPVVILMTSFLNQNSMNDVKPYWRRFSQFSWLKFSIIHHIASRKKTKSQAPGIKSLFCFAILLLLLPVWSYWFAWQSGFAYDFPKYCSFFPAVLVLSFCFLHCTKWMKNWLSEENWIRFVCYFVAFNLFIESSFCSYSFP